MASRQLDGSHLGTPLILRRRSRQERNQALPGHLPLSGSRLPRPDLGGLVAHAQLAYDRQVLEER